MPGKGRRMASRQAELGRRRRRQHRGGNAAVAERPRASAPNETDAVTAVAEETAAATPAASTRPAQQVREPVEGSRSRSGPRSRFDRPAAYNYVMPEMRRILIMGGVLLAGLIGLSFFI